MITYHFIVTGKVQGVGFRFFTYMSAKKLGIRGWVRNLDSGEVEVMAQGDSESIQNFKMFLNRGPSFSKVTDLSETILEREEFNDFKISN